MKLPFLPDSESEGENCVPADVPDPLHQTGTLFVALRRRLRLCSCSTVFSSAGDREVAGPEERSVRDQSRLHLRGHEALVQQKTHLLAEHLPVDDLDRAARRCGHLTDLDQTTICALKRGRYSRIDYNN